MLCSRYERSQDLNVCHWTEQSSPSDLPASIRERDAVFPTSCRALNSFQEYSTCKNDFILAIKHFI